MKKTIPFIALSLLFTTVATAAITIGGTTITFDDATTQDTAPVEWTKIYNIPDTGSDVDNGTALQAAITEISGLTPTASNRFVIRLDAADYDVGSTGLVIPDYTLIEGAGETASRIIGEDTANLGMITLGTYSILKDFTVISTRTSSSADAAAIDTTGSTLCAIYSVAVNLEGTGNPGNGIGINVTGGTPIVIKDCSISVTTASSTNNYGILIDDGGVVIVERSLIIANSASSRNSGVEMTTTSIICSFEAKSTRIIASGTLSDFGIYMASDKCLTTLNDCKIECTLGTGVSSPGGSVGVQSITIRNSIITTPTAAGDSVYAGPYATGKIANTEMKALPLSDSGSDITIIDCIYNTFTDMTDGTY